MHLLSNEALLAITAVVDIAIHGHDAPVRSDEITSRLGLSRGALEPVLRSLACAGAVMSTNEEPDGYRLARDPRKISVEDILRASGVLANDDDELSDPEAILVRAIVLSVLWAAGAAFVKELRAISVSDLVQAAADGSARIARAS
jgi:Rrf2 family transcriptional regulator, iron-sulfur cluster assembly transcription factor